MGLLQLFFRRGLFGGRRPAWRLSTLASDPFHLELQLDCRIGGAIAQSKKN